MDSKESKSRSWTRRSRGPQVPGTQFAKNASTDGASEQSGPSLSRTVSSLKAEINSPSKLSSVRNLRRSVTALHAHNKPGKGLTPVTSFARPDAPFAQDFADSRANRDDEVVQEIPSPSHRGQLSPALENASQTQSLHLDHMSWTELPPRVNIFLLDLGCRLREVSIVGSHLKELPEGLSQLRSLEALSVDSNDMEYLPDWLGGLGCLTSLVVSRNKLRSLPTALGTCSSLVRLEASYNKLTSLPHTLGALPALKTLHAHHNRIEVLPDAFFSLGALSDLSLNHNRMTAVPAAVHRLGALRRLSLHHNCLVALPRSIGGVGGGRLEVLEVSDNALTVLCPEISRVSHLTKLTVGCNPLLHPPQDVVRHGIDAIMEYLRRWGTELAQSREEDGPESETEPYSDMSLEPSQETLSPASATGGPEGAAKPGPRLRADEVARPQGAPANGEGAGGMAVGGRGHDAGPCPRCGEEGREEQRREEREREWGRERARLLKRVEEAERDLERYCKEEEQLRVKLSSTLAKLADAQGAASRSKEMAAAEANKGVSRIKELEREVAALAAKAQRAEEESRLTKKKWAALERQVAESAKGMSRSQKELREYKSLQGQAVEERDSALKKIQSLIKENLLLKDELEIAKLEAQDRLEDALDAMRQDHVAQLRRAASRRMAERSSSATSGSSGHQSAEAARGGGGSGARGVEERKERGEEQLTRDMREREERVREREEGLEERERKLEETLRGVGGREKKVEEREKKVEEREKKVEEREGELGKQVAGNEQREATLAEMRREIGTLKASLAERARELGEAEKRGREAQEKSEGETRRMEEALEVARKELEEERRKGEEALAQATSVLEEERGRDRCDSVNAREAERAAGKAKKEAEQERRSAAELRMQISGKDGAIRELKALLDKEKKASAKAAGRLASVEGTVRDLNGQLGEEREARQALQEGWEKQRIALERQLQEARDVMHHAKEALERDRAPPEPWEGAKGGERERMVARVGELERELRGSKEREEALQGRVQELEHLLEAKPGTLQAMKGAILHHVRRDFVSISNPSRPQQAPRRGLSSPSIAPPRPADAPCPAPKADAHSGAPREEVGGPLRRKPPSMNALGALGGGGVQLYYQCDSAGVSAASRVWGRTLSGGAGASAFASVRR